ARIPQREDRRKELKISPQEPPKKSTRILFLFPFRRAICLRVPPAQASRHDRGSMGGAVKVHRPCFQRLGARSAERAGSLGSGSKKPAGKSPWPHGHARLQDSAWMKPRSAHRKVDAGNRSSPSAQAPQRPSPARRRKRFTVKCAYGRTLEAIRLRAACTCLHAP